MYKKLILNLTVFIFVLCVTVTPAAAVLKVGILPDADSIPLIVAREEGLFSETGEEIELVNFNNPIERDSALQAGAIDGAISDVLAAAFAIDNGHEVLITSITNGRYVLLSAPESEITEYSDLEGVQIAISSNTIIEYITDQLLVENGLTDHVEKVAIPKIPVRLQMLEAGKVKAACLPEPLASVVQLKGAIKVGSSDDLGEAPGVLLFTSEAVSDKTDEIKAFYQAYSKAVDLVNENADSYRGMLVTRGGFPEEIKDTFEFPEYDQPRLPAKTTVELVLNWLTAKELINRDYSFQELVTEKFVGE